MRAIATSISISIFKHANHKHSGQMNYAYLKQCSNCAKGVPQKRGQVLKYLSFLK
jgi:hypothetical protein